MTLLPAEGAMFMTDSEETSAGVSDDQIAERYARGDVRIVTEQARYPLTALPDMVDSPDYELNPEFQRRHRWDDQRKSRLIESFIMNVPIPPIFLYEDDFGHYEVMDGLQRLSAIRDYYRGLFALTGLEEWAALNGRLYDQLPDAVRRGIDRRYLSSIILLRETAKSPEEAQRLKQLVFERINSGGEKLTPQESRNAIYPGPMNEMCLRLARLPDLCAMWHIPAPSAEEADTGSPREGDPVLQNSLYRRMNDVELVLRFFAYRQQLEHQGSRALKDFLDDFLKRGNSLPASELAELAVLFSASATLVRGLFGEQAIYMLKPAKDGLWRYAERPTYTVYDPLMWAASRRVDVADDLLERRQSAQRLLAALYQANAESFSGRTANPADIRTRNRLFEELFNDILGHPRDADQRHVKPLEVMETAGDLSSSELGMLASTEVEREEAGRLSGE